MFGQWTRFSLRLLFVIAVVVAAYASGKATMARRAQVAEMDAAHARERAIDLEARLRSARIQLAAVQLAANQPRLHPSNWPSKERVVFNNRWIIDSMAINEYQHAAHLDSLGIKLIGQADDGKSFQIVSDFSAGPTVAKCDEVPTDFIMIEANDQDRLLLVHSGVTVPTSGVMRLLPMTLADEMARAEARFTAIMGLSISDLEKTWFHLDNRPLRTHPRMSAHVRAHRLAHVEGRAPSYPYRLPPAGARPKNSMRQTSPKFRTEVLGQ